MGWAAACLIKVPHAETGLAGADVGTHKGRLQSGRPGCILCGRLEAAQHERCGCTVGWIGRHVRRQVSRCLVGRQRSLQWRAATDDAHAEIKEKEDPKSAHIGAAQALLSIEQGRMATSLATAPSFLHAARSLSDATVTKLNQRTHRENYAVRVLSLLSSLSTETTIATACRVSRRKGGL